MAAGLQRVQDLPKLGHQRRLYTREPLHGRQNLQLQELSMRRRRRQLVPPKLQVFRAPLKSPTHPPTYCYLLIFNSVFFLFFLV